MSDAKNNEQFLVVAWWPTGNDTHSNGIEHMGSWLTTLSHIVPVIFDVGKTYNLGLYSIQGRMPREASKPRD